MKRLLVVLFILAVMFSAGSVAFKAAGFGDVTEALQDQPDPNAPGPPQVDYVEYPDFEFGVMDINTKGRHTFRIGNKGASPLRLRFASSSCSCTVSNIQDNAILPGETGEVEVVWETPEYTQHFAQSVTLLTNDKREPAIVLRIQGAVQAKVIYQPEELTFPNVSHGETLTGEFLVLAPKADALKISRTSDADADWVESIEELSAEEAASHGATAASRVKIRLPKDLKSGYFTQPVPISVELTTGDEVEQRIDRPLVRGTVQSSAALFGRKIQSDGYLRVGALRNGEGANEDVFMVLREAKDPVEILAVEYEPTWLKIDVTPQEAEKEGERLFKVHVEVPRDAPVCMHTGSGAVPITIRTNHPRTPVVRFFLEFAVISPGVKLEIH